MRADERRNLPDDDRDDAEQVEELEDLEASEDDAAAVKGGGPKNQTIQTGGGPSD